jgi:hypothetical protein
MSRLDPQLRIRLPAEEKRWIEHRAKANKRTQSAEIALAVRQIMKMERPMRIVHVDFNGHDEEGNDYTQVATPEPLSQGLMTQERVKLQYPDGTFGIGNEIKITEKGMAHFKRLFGRNGSDGEGFAGL